MGKKSAAQGKPSATRGWSLTVSIGVVSKPQAKNSRKITTTAWYTLGSPIPCRCKTKFLIKDKHILVWDKYIWLGAEMSALTEAVPPPQGDSVRVYQSLPVLQSPLVSFFSSLSKSIFDTIKPSLKTTEHITLPTLTLKSFDMDPNAYFDSSRCNSSEKAPKFWKGEFSPQCWLCSVWWKRQRSA